MFTAYQCATSMEKTAVGAQRALRTRYNMISKSIFVCERQHKNTGRSSFSALAGKNLSDLMRRT